MRGWGCVNQKEHPLLSFPLKLPLSTSSFGSLLGRKQVGLLCLVQKRRDVESAYRAVESAYRASTGALCSGSTSGGWDPDFNSDHSLQMYPNSAEWLELPRCFPKTCHLQEWAHFSSDSKWLNWGGGVTNCKLVTCKLTKWWENLCVDALLIPNSRSLTTMQFHYGESYLRAIWSQALWKINPHKVQVRYNFRGCKWKDFFVPQINRLTGLWS